METLAGTTSMALAALTPWLATAMLLALRLAPVVWLVPVLGGERVPATVRSGALAALVLTLAPAVGPTTSSALLALAAWQMLVGVASGAAAGAWAAAVQSVGGALDSSYGRGAFGGASGAGGPTGAAFGLAFAAAFAASGGHLVVLVGLGESMAALPLQALPAAGAAGQVAMALVRVGQAALTATVAMALPALMAGVIADLTLGWLNRAMPALPAMFLSMPVRALLGVAVAAALLAAAVDVGVGAVPDALMAPIDAAAAP